jgi:hypothetical protein
MMSIALVTGDEFLLAYNLTIGAEDVLDYMKRLFVDWKDTSVFKNAYFDDKDGINFAGIVGPTGFCYNFNLADAAKLFNLNE